MSNEEKRTILYDAVARAYNAIAETPGDEMKSERFGYLLYNLDRMENIAADLPECEDGQQEVTGAVGDPNLCTGHDDNTGTTEEPLAVEATEPEQPDAEAEAEEPTTYTKEEVKSALAKARVLVVMDYKAGIGVPVSAVENPQTRLYGLGATVYWQCLFSFERIENHIVQPGRDNISVEELSKEDLLAWGESIKPNAQLAWEGKGEYDAGEWCRFCPARALC